jgi:hypothetical protein
MFKSIFLQASMAFWILLMEFGKILLFAGIPFLTIILTFRSIAKKKTVDPNSILSTNEILRITLVNFLYAILGIIIIAIVIIVLLFLTVNLSDS